MYTKDQQNVMDESKFNCMKSCEYVYNENYKECEQECIDNHKKLVDLEITSTFVAKISLALVLIVSLLTILIK